MTALKWDDIASCRGQYTEDFYPENSTVLKAVKAICTECPVQTACLVASIPERYGFWAGKTMIDRDRMRTSLGIVLADNDADVHQYRRAAAEGFRTGDYLSALTGILGPATARAALEGVEHGPKRVA